VHSSGDEYWVATESGIFIYNLATGKYVNLRKHYSNPYSISDNAVYSLCADSEGGIWAGTHFGGVNYYPKQYMSFEKLFPKSDENSISGNAVREIRKDHYGDLWIGTEDAGLNKFNPENGIFTNFKPTGAKTSLAHYNIHGLLATGDELWIGTFEHGLDVMDIKTGKIIRHYSAGTQAGSIKSNFVYAIHQTRSGEILVCTSMVLYRYHRESDDFTVLPEFPDGLHYTAILDDDQGTLWAGTYRDGIYYFNPETNKKGYFKHEPENKNSLSSNTVNGIFEDSNNDLWFATDGGLCKLSPRGNHIKRYTVKEGFPSNVIYSLLEDKHRNLWASTSKGLVCFNPTTEKIKIFTKAHGLLSDQFNYNSAYKDASGKMYFGSINGLISFNPAEFIKNTFIPPIDITGFQIHNKELAVGKNNSPLKNSITFTDKLLLQHDQSSFSLDFAALSYTAPQMAEYAYKMEGLDKGWNFLKANRKVYFTELPPGKYTFMVKASNSSGLWNEQATQLEIEIQPPFWASYWAYLLYTALGAITMYYVIRNYHRQTERKNERKIQLLENEKEKEVYQAKIEFFTTVAHEIRTPLTLIKGPLEKVIKTTSGIPEVKDKLIVMEKNTRRLLDLVNQLLDFRTTETKGFSLNFAKADISELVRDTYYSFKPAAEQENLSFKIDLPDLPLYAYVDREALTKILSNLFNNALKYAENRVLIQVLPCHSEDVFFSIEIKNDGYLIPFEIRENIFEPFFRLQENGHKPGTGIGLPLARSLAELHKGTLELQRPENDLNVFVLRLPIHQEKEYNLYDEEVAEAPSTEIIKEEDPDSLKPVILVVEDNKELLEFISGELSAEYTVVKTCNGEKALHIIKEESIQLIVSDVMMAGINGFELCKQVKSNLEYSHIPFILLTAKNSLQAKIEGLESGADAYIEKPFSPEHLQVQIDNLLRNRKKIKEYFSSSPLAHIKSIAYSKADEHFLEKLHEIIYENIADTELNVEHLAAIMNMSRPTLYRKIKALSNLTPNELINIARLKKAAALLSEGNYKIYEVASMVGYNSQTSFGRNFLKQFGMTPSEYTSPKEGAGKNK
jgi:signal transduction histidine kinase/ligand-binding sensor domain-containing protein/DNA-binding response OmpR family regulator